jgi:hypothetical protein
VPRIVQANHKFAVAEDFDGETVVIHFERGTYFSLRGGAPALWSMLAVPVSEDAMSAALAGRGVEVALAAETVRGFVTRMLEEGLAVEAEGPSAAAGDLAVPEGFDPATVSVEVHSDLADLIAVDPVHEVDAMAGWPVRPEDAGE